MTDPSAGDPTLTSTFTRPSTNGMPSTFTVPSTDGVEVVVHDLGGAGPLLIMGHATGFCGPMWAPLAAGLTDRFHCVAVDFRGHGRTGLPDGVSLRWTGMADDVTAVIDHLSPGSPAWALGHSMGGTALILAEAARPGLVERAWMFEPILFPLEPVRTGDQGPPIAQGARARRDRFSSRAEARQRYRQRPPLSLLDSRCLDAYLDHGFETGPGGSVRLRCRPEWEASVFEHHNTGALDLVGQIDTELRLVVGNRRSANGEENRPSVMATQAAQRHPHLTVVEYPELSHFGPLQAPDQLVRDVARFFG